VRQAARQRAIPGLQGARGDQQRPPAQPSTVPKRWVAPDTPTAKINVTDPDSRKRQDAARLPQGDNAQAVCNEQ
jgi:hypothetical protein